jgi:hypothetical protein
MGEWFRIRFDEGRGLDRAALPPDPGAPPGRTSFTLIGGTFPNESD